MIMRFGKVFVVASLMFALGAAPAFARDVAFVEPGTGAANGTPDEAFKIEPKAEIDIGDSIINIVRRETLFFVNQTSAPIKIEKITLSNDSTVNAVVVNDDCSKESVVPPLSRCSIELSVTPTGPGSWGIELLMTHNGPGRITRAKIDGKTAGSDAGDKKERGLFLNARDTKPVDFGEITVGDGKIVRSALMTNDSPSPITIYSVDVVEADKSLQKLDTGCAPDMELKAGESCPVTLVWAPTSRSVISTDLIIRHSGQMGFAVVPIRGTAKGQKKGDKDSDDGGGSNNSSNAPPGITYHDPSPDLGVKNGFARNDVVQQVAPPTPSQVAREVAKATSGGGNADMISAATGTVHLIGTVGNRAVLLKPDGTTGIVQVGDLVDVGGSAPGKVLSISATNASLMVNGKKIDLVLEAVQELKDRAAANKKDSNQPSFSDNGGGSK